METVRGWATVVQHTQTSYLEPIMFGGVARSLSKNPLKTIRGMGGLRMSHAKRPVPLKTVAMHWEHRN